MMIAGVVAATAAGWALGGSALSRALATDRAGRVGVVLGLFAGGVGGAALGVTSAA